MNQEDIRKLTERFVAMRQASAARGPTQAQAAQAAPSAAAGVAPEAVRLSSAQLSAALSGLSVRAPARVFTARDYQRFLDRILSLVEHVKGYEDFDLQDKAREVIPVDELHAEAHRRQEAEPGSDFDEHLMRSMLRWFKNDFFKWVDKPPCDSCGGSTVAMGVGPPLPDERRFGAGSTEIYRCESCSAITRFPRYNDLVKLLETRRGRCGEWANVFCLVCRTMGFETRYVLDFTDHVWTEVFSNKHQRWIHCDSCEGEGAYDTPLLYESGWGKKLTYVIAIGVHDIVDVTRRYSRSPEIWQRRTLVDEAWIRPALLSIAMRNRFSLSDSFRKELAKRDLDEQAELEKAHPTPTATESVLPGRQSGAAEWREARGETGGK